MNYPQKGPAGNSKNSALAADCGAAGHSYGGGHVWWAHRPESPADQGSWPLEKSFETNTLDEFYGEISRVAPVVEAWFSDRLLGQQTNGPAGTWHDIPPSYAAALTAKYNAWLNRRRSAESLARLRAEAGVGAGEPVPRLRRDQFEKASKERFQAEAGFYMDVEREFFTMMARYLREELRVKSLLIGNSDHNHGRSGYPMVAGASLLDVVNGHVYWQHPNYRTDAKTGRQTGFDISNTAMVAGHFDFAEDPVKLSQLAAGALLFRRGDARRAVRTVARSYTAEQVRESLRLPWAEQHYFTPGFPLTLPLQHARRLSSFEGPPTRSFEGTAASPIQSDTGELAWQCAGKGSGLVVVSTPRSQALIGYCGGRRPATENLEAGVNVPFCAITVQPLDGAGRPLGQLIGARQSSQGWTFRLGEPATTWFVVAVGR